MKKQTNYILFSIILLIIFSIFNLLAFNQIKEMRKDFYEQIVSIANNIDTNIQEAYAGGNFSAFAKILKLKTQDSPIRLVKIVKNTKELEKYPKNIKQNDLKGKNYYSYSKNIILPQKEIMNLQITADKTSFYEKRNKIYYAVGIFNLISLFFLILIIKSGKKVEEVSISNKSNEHDILSPNEMEEENVPEINIKAEETPKEVIKKPEIRIIKAPKDPLIIRKELGLENNIDAFDLPILKPNTEIIGILRTLSKEESAALSPMEKKIWEKSLQGTTIRKIYRMFGDEEVKAYRTISKMLYSKLITVRK